MAEEKNSFLFYTDWGDVFDQLPDEQAGKLIKHICDYVRDLDPETDDIIVKLAFTPMRATLKRDLKKWEKSKGQKKSSGALGNLKRWHPDLFDSVKAGDLTIDKAVEIAKGRKVSHRDVRDSQDVAKVAVSDSVSATVSESVSETDVFNNEDNQIERETLENYLTSSFTWHEHVCRSMKSNHGVEITPDEVREWLPKFCDELQGADDLYKTNQENKKHFLHWLPKKLKNSKATTQEPKKSRHDATLDHNMETANELAQLKQRGGQNPPE